MKGEFEKRSQAWVPKKPNAKGIYVAEDWVKLEIIDEARKEIFACLGSAYYSARKKRFSKPIKVKDLSTQDLLVLTLEKWFGTAK